MMMMSAPVRLVPVPRLAVNDECNSLFHRSGTVYVIIKKAVVQKCAAPSPDLYPGPNLYPEFHHQFKTGHWMNNTSENLKKKNHLVDFGPIKIKNKKKKKKKKTQAEVKCGFVKERAPEAASDFICQPERGAEWVKRCQLKAWLGRNHRVATNEKSHGK